MTRSWAEFLNTGVAFVVLKYLWYIQRLWFSWISLGTLNESLLHLAEPTLGARDCPQRRQGCKPVWGQLATCSPHERKGRKPTVAVWALHNTIRWLWHGTWCFLSLYPKNDKTPLVRMMLYLIYSLGVYKVFVFCFFVCFNLPLNYTWKCDSDMYQMSNGKRPEKVS